MNPGRLLACLLLLAGACERGTSVAPRESLDPVVAEYSGRKITLGEVDAAAAQELFRLRADTLNALLANDLVPREAKRRGITEQELLDVEVTAKIPIPTEEELRARYAQAEMAGELQPGASFERYREQMLGVAKHHGTGDRREEYLHELTQAAGLRTDPDAIGIRRLPIGDVSASPARGARNASVTVVEFADFTSPFCAQGNSTVRLILETSSEYVRFVFRQNPAADERAHLAARAALCAHEQHKYWEYREKLFANQRAISGPAVSDFAAQLGLNTAAFDVCLKSEKTAAEVAKDVADAKRLDLDGSPEFLVDGIRLSGAHPAATFAKVIDLERNRLRH